MPPESATPTAPTASVETTPSVSTPTSAGNESTPAPASTPAESSNAFDFESFSQEFEGSDEVPAEEEVPAATPPAVAKPAVKPTPAAPVADKPAPAPVAATPTDQPPAQPTPAPTTPTQPAAAPAKAPTDQERRVQYDNWRKTSEQRLGELYKLSNEDTEKMLSNPEQVLPQLAARLHLDVYESVLSDFYQRIPQVVSSLMQQQNSERANEDAFFGAFPKLREHRQAVERFATAFRQVNPQMPKDDFIKQVGLAMMASLGIPFEAPAAPVAPTQAPAPAPASQPRVVARDIVTPGGGFTPAPTGASPHPGGTPTAPRTIWDEMSQDLLEDDRQP